MNGMTEAQIEALIEAKLKNAGMPTLLIASVSGNTVLLELQRENMPSLVTAFTLPPAEGSQ